MFYSVKLVVLVDKLDKPSKFEKVSYKNTRRK